jgi:hypothetical protein
MINLANLEDANKICAEYGLPILTAADAVKFYGEWPRFNASPDRGANDAASGSPTWWAKWAISLTLHEGKAAVDAALGVQNRVAEQF